MKKKVNYTISFTIPIILLILLSILTYVFNLDTQISAFFYSNENQWIYSKSNPWHFLYEYGQYPAIIVSVLSIVLFISKLYKKFNIRKKILFYIPLTLIIGPGIIVNSIFKQNWGRPRPRDTKIFSGDYNFEKLLTIDTSSPGTSFVCGHCSVAFFFWIYFFIFYNTSIKLSYFFLFFGFLYGIFMATARIAVGAHFFSDTVWSAGFTFLTASSLYHLLKIYNAKLEKL